MKLFHSTKTTAEVRYICSLFKILMVMLTIPTAQYQATQINTKINEVQKQIGIKRKVGFYLPLRNFEHAALISVVSQAKENADVLMGQKGELEKEKKALIDSAAEKDVALRKKISTIGNFVHDSVPISDNEVWVMTSLQHDQRVSF